MSKTFLGVGTFSNIVNGKTLFKDEILIEQKLLLITAMGGKDDSRVRWSVGGWYRPLNLHLGGLSGSSNLKTF